MLVLVVGVFLLQLLNLRLNFLHFRDRLVALIGERQEGELDEHGHGEDREAEVAENLEEEVDDAGTSAG